MILSILIKKIPTFDFAIILADATDIMEKEIKIDEGKTGKTFFPVMRDNVLFECGLCIMALGTDRVILLKEKSIRIPEDLHNGLKEMGIKTFEYSNSLENISENLECVNKHIEKKALEMSPIVIGAAISTADGYLNNFILRFWENISKGFIDLNTKEKFNPDPSHIHMNICIPYEISNNLREKILDYYETNNYEQGIIPQGNFRGVEFRYKMIGNECFVCDYPSTLTASYNTVKDILELNADDKYDMNAEARFLMKEHDSFIITLEKLMKKESLIPKLENFSYYQKNKTEIQRILNLMEQVKIIEL